MYKRVGIHELKYMKGYGNLVFRNLKGSLIKIFRTDATYGRNTSFVKRHKNLTRRLAVERFIHTTGQLQQLQIKLFGIY